MEEEKKTEDVDIRFTNKDSGESESVHNETHYEGKINLEEMILKSTDRLIEEKKTVETKAVGYLAFVALILAIVNDFFPKTIGCLKEKCFFFDNLSYLFFLLTFVIGLALIIVCALILHPKEISYFTPETLTQLYKDSLKLDARGEVDECLLQGNEDAIPTNAKTLKKMDDLNKIASVFLWILIGVFTVDIILYFVFWGGVK